jgi:hypothetical protein
VAKTGRSSSSTIGYLSATLSLVRLNVESPEEELPPPMKCYAIAAGSDHPDCSCADAKPYISKGDVGSLILTDARVSPIIKVNGAARIQPVMLGLAIGTHLMTLMSYMTPMYMIIKDIEAVTGGKISEPTLQSL